MPFSFTINVTEGSYKGQSFEISERMACLIGRHKRCNIHIPKSLDKSISRYHCLIDINPPNISIQDLGSTNGTFINGYELKQLAYTTSGNQQGGSKQTIDIILQDGDIITVGETKFRVHINDPKHCLSCKSEIPSKNAEDFERKPGIYLCNNCFPNMEQGGHLQNLFKACVRCAKDVSVENREGINGDYLCEKCRQDIIATVTDIVKKNIPNYELDSMLIQWGISSVFSAVNTKTREQKVIKFIIPKHPIDGVKKDNFLREVETFQQLSHPNVVNIDKVGYSNGVFYIMREFCDGGSLYDLMKKRQGPLSCHEACKIILKTLDGLIYAHEHQAKMDYHPSRKQNSGILHCNLKPSNILLDGTGKSREIKISDFGLANAIDSAGLDSFTQIGLLTASFYFISRQHLLYYKNSSPEVDVWSIAAILYYMITGFPPRDFPENQTHLESVLKNEPVLVRERNRDIPGNLGKLLDSVLVDNRDLTFKSAREFKEALLKVC